METKTVIDIPVELAEQSDAYFKPNNIRVEMRYRKGKGYSIELFAIQQKEGCMSRMFEFGLQNDKEKSIPVAVANRFNRKRMDAEIAKVTPDTYREALTAVAAANGLRIISDANNQAN
jgi:hypothetical protein